MDTYGFGSLVPNTILLGETEKPEHFLAYADLIMRVSRTRRNLIIVREGEEPPEFDTTPRTSPTAIVLAAAEIEFQRIFR